MKIRKIAGGSPMPSQRMANGIQASGERLRKKFTSGRNAWRAQRRVPEQEARRHAQEHGQEEPARRRGRATRSASSRRRPLRSSATRPRATASGWGNSDAGRRRATPRPPRRRRAAPGRRGRSTGRVVGRSGIGSRPWLEASIEPRSARTRDGACARSQARGGRDPLESQPGDRIGTQGVGVPPLETSPYSAMPAPVRRMQAMRGAAFLSGALRATRSARIAALRAVEEGHMDRPIARILDLVDPGEPEAVERRPRRSARPPARRRSRGRARGRQARSRSWRGRASACAWRGASTGRCATSSPRTRAARPSWWPSASTRSQRALAAEGWSSQFHPTYTRMVPAHHVTTLRLIGCPDPNPVHRRFFDPPRGVLPPDLDRHRRALRRARCTRRCGAGSRAQDARAPIGVAVLGRHRQRRGAAVPLPRAARRGPEPGAAQGVHPRRRRRRARTRGRRASSCARTDLEMLGETIEVGAGGGRAPTTRWR